MLFQHVLSGYRIQRVSKLVGNTGIDYAEKLVLGSLLVKHDAVGDVDYLDYSLPIQRAILHLNIFISKLIAFAFLK